MIGSKKILLCTPLKDFYALTISPPESNRDPRKSYSEDRDSITQLMTPFSDHYMMYPEFTELGRLHYHGLVYVSDKIKFYHTKHLLGILGFCMWKPLRKYSDQLNWLIYCMKNIAICGLEPIKYMTKANYKRKQFFCKLTKSEMICEKLKQAKAVLVEQEYKLLKKRAEERIIQRQKDCGTYKESPSGSQSN